jgi:hypothetical protein
MRIFTGERQEADMRVRTIDLADITIACSAVRDSDGGFLWVVKVEDRGPEHRMVLERRGRCGRVTLGDALDFAARQAREIADRYLAVTEPRPVADRRQDLRV